MTPLFVTPARASSAAALAVTNGLADTAQVVHRTRREPDRSLTRGFAAVLYKAGRFIGHVDPDGRVVRPSVPVFAG